MGRANRLLDRHLIDHPRDLFALQLTHMGDLVLGQSDHAARPHRPRARPLERRRPGLRLRAGHARLRPRGMQRVRARRGAGPGRRWRCNPHDAWAVHAVAHVYEMQGRVDDGIRWLDARHRALAAGQHARGAQPLAPGAACTCATATTAAALALYDRAIAPAPASMALDLVDASALLWRLTLRGVDVGDALAGAGGALARAGRPGAGSVFNDVHALLALVGRAARRRASRPRGAPSPRCRPTAPAPWWREAGAACEAMHGLRRRPLRATARELLLPLLHATARLRRQPGAAQPAPIYRHRGGAPRRRRRATRRCAARHGAPGRRRAARPAEGPRVQPLLPATAPSAEAASTSASASPTDADSGRCNS